MTAKKSIASSHKFSARFVVFCFFVMNPCVKEERIALLQSTLEASVERLSAEDRTVLVENDRLVFIQFLNEIVAKQSYFINNVDQRTNIQRVLGCIVRFCRKIVLDRSTTNLENIDALCGTVHETALDNGNESLSEVEKGINSAKGGATMVNGTEDATGGNMKDLCELLIELLILSCLPETLDAIIAEKCCTCIMIVCSNHSSNQLKCGTARGSLALVYALNVHVATPIVVEMACRCIRNISASDDAAVEIASLNLQNGSEGEASSGINEDEDPGTYLPTRDEISPVIVDVLNVEYKTLCNALIASSKLHMGTPASDATLMATPPDYNVMEAILWAIVNLSCDTHIATLLGAAGAVQYVVKCLELYLAYYTGATHVEGSTEPPIAILTASLMCMRNLTAENRFNLNVCSSIPITSILMQILMYCAELPISSAGPTDSNDSIERVSGGEDKYLGTTPSKKINLTTIVATTTSYNKMELVESCLWCLANLTSDPRVAKTLISSGINVSDACSCCNCQCSKVKYSFHEVLLYIAIIAQYPVPEYHPTTCSYGSQTTLFYNFLPGQIAEALVHIIHNQCSSHEAARELFGRRVELQSLICCQSTHGRVISGSINVCELVCQILNYYKNLPVMSETCVNALIVCCVDCDSNRDCVVQYNAKNWSIQDADDNSKLWELKVVEYTSIVDILIELINLHLEEVEFMDRVMKMVYLLCMNNRPVQEKFLENRSRFVVTKEENGAEIPSLPSFPVPPSPSAEMSESYEATASSEISAAAKASMDVRNNNILVYTRNIIFTHRKYVDIVRMGCELLLLLHYAHKPEELSRLIEEGTVVDLNVIKAKQEEEMRKTKLESETDMIAVPSESSSQLPPAPPTATEESMTQEPDWHVKITGNFQTIVDAWLLDTNKDFDGSDSVIIAGVGQ